MKTYPSPPPFSPSLHTPPPFFLFFFFLPNVGLTQDHLKSQHNASSFQSILSFFTSPFFPLVSYYTSYCTVMSVMLHWTKFASEDQWRVISSYSCSSPIILESKPQLKNFFWLTTFLKDSVFGNFHHHCSFSTSDQIQEGVGHIRYSTLLCIIVDIVSSSGWGWSVTSTFNVFFEKNFGIKKANKVQTKWSLLIIIDRGGSAQDNFHNQIAVSAGEILRKMFPF